MCLRLVFITHTECVCVHRSIPLGECTHTHTHMSSKLGLLRRDLFKINDYKRKSHIKRTHIHRFFSPFIQTFDIFISFCTLHILCPLLLVLAVIHNSVRRGVPTPITINEANKQRNTEKLQRKLYHNTHVTTFNQIDTSAILLLLVRALFVWCTLFSYAFVIVFIYSMGGGVFVVALGLQGLVEKKYILFFCSCVGGIRRMLREYKDTKAKDTLLDYSFKEAVSVLTVLMVLLGYI